MRATFENRGNNEWLPFDIDLGVNLEEMEGAVALDGLDGALVGAGNQYTKRPLLVYSAQKIVAILMERDGMTDEEAWEFFSHNIEGLWAGEGTPIIIHDVVFDS